MRIIPLQFGGQGLLQTGFQRQCQNDNVRNSISGSVFICGAANLIFTLFLGDLFCFVLGFWGERGFFGPVFGFFFWFGFFCLVLLGWGSFCLFVCFVLSLMKKTAEWKHSHFKQPCIFQKLLEV